MTQEREEQLISDVGEIKGSITQLIKEFDGMKPSLATHDEVKAVERKVDDHIDENTENRRWRWAQVVAIVAAAVPGLVALFKKAG